MHLFGGAKKKDKPEANPHDGITKLKETEAQLTKRKEVMEHKANEETKKIKELMQTKTDKNKKAALMCLKRRKMYEKSSDDLDKMTMNLATQILTLENAKVNMEAFKAQQTTTDYMKKIHGNMDIEQVEEAKMDMEEQLDLAGEITAALTNPLGGQEEDEDDLLAELEDMEQELMDESMAEVGATEVHLDAGMAAMPSAPAGAPVLVAPVMTDEERELAELEASMA
mmetsp:Transcript_48985/g.71823  ORF Transcript_48985/g.71823 Transcript_48985/m.71823 type:complete len:226 (+) Transcript_48985:237-914(+)|eukprot:CAMPEP_0179427992 /NCGR_PEP_ID=MMETSP0799-20121207/13785_1 /TAXON_ID=46947 /ORGANISM="Geminigera cryophila, Strain CCMP2564" /LENGTH=225 /DNA_ID=CAMNT_0021203283 /DNA_START=234 /DNA_END=911 /DNA_ORIENTATION=-